MVIDLREYGYSYDIKLRDDIVPARITEMHRELYTAICAYGEVNANLTGSFLHGIAERNGYPAVGDFVLLRYNPAGVSSVVSLLPRSSKFSRTDYSGHNADYVKTILEQVVAANFDYVFIMSSLNRDFNLNRIARYLTMARQSGAVPVVILTKADLCADPEIYISEIHKLAPDIDVISLSSVTGEGLDKLDFYLKPGKTIVFLGMSGVGKSSLLNALAGEKLMEVKEIREEDARGRHTTTHRQLIRLSSGAMVIDTPGMRELGLWDAGEGIKASFADVEALILKCRFSDCGHRSEPGCAVRIALEDGTLLREQWENYLTQRREAKFVEDKSGFIKDKRSFQKNTARFSKNIRKVKDNEYNY